MTNTIKHFTLVTAAMAALAMGTGPLARAATPSETGPNINAAIRSGSSVWTWPIDKEARSHVWIDARSAKTRSAQVRPWSALRKSVFLGGL
jgi:hypothetical protein